MKKRKYYLIFLSAFLTLLTFFGLASCDNRKYNTITASAESGVGISDSHFLLLTDGLTCQTDSMLSLDYTVSRRYFDDMTSKIQTFSTSTDGYTYYMEGWAEYSFELSLDDLNRFTRVKIYVTKDNVYFYLHLDSSYVHEKLIAFEFDCFGIQKILIHGNMKDYKVVESPVTFDNYKCIRKIENRDGQVLPFTSGDSFNFRVFGPGIDSKLSYDVRMDYTICGFGTGTYTQRFAKDGWEWLGKLWSWNVARYRLVSTEIDYTKSNSETIDTENSEYSPAGLVIYDRQLSSECLSVFENHRFLNGLQVDPSVVFADCYDYAYNVAYGYDTWSVSIEYLQEIPDTPFAYKYTQVLTIELTGREQLISYDVIASAFNLNHLSLPAVVCNSALENFVVLSCDSNLKAMQCKAVYYASQQIFLKTQDGQVSYMTVDCNQSFADYYAPFAEYSTDKGAFLDVVLNDIIINQYGSILENYELEVGRRLYGRWGWAIMPQTTNLLNDILVGDLNTTATQGIKYYTIQGALSKANYESVLTDYGYSDIAIAGNNLANYFDDNVSNCTYYVFFTEADEYKGGIGVGDNPTDENDDPAFKDKVQQGLNDVGAWFKDALDKILNNNKPDFDFVKCAKIIGVTLLSGFGIFLGVKAFLGRK